MIVLTDCDGVIADFVGGLCRELALRGFVRTPEQIRHWDLRESLPPEEARAAHEIMAAPGFCHALEWYEGAREFLRAAHELAEVHAVTAPYRASPSWMHERLTWLSAAVVPERVHFVSGKHKHLVRGDVLIEDHPQTAYAWADAHPRGLAILIDRPWNSPQAKEFWPHSRMVRVRSFEEALETVKELT